MRIKLYNTIIMDLIEYIQYHETKLHEQPGFSYNTYLCTIPLDFPSVALHWHEQMEIIYIKKGRGIVNVNMTEYEVHAGTIIPIMPGELHSIEGLPDERMEYENIIFSLSVLSSTEQNDWCTANIIKPMQQGHFHFERPIRPGTPFHKEISKYIDQADEACRNRTGGYSLVVKSCLFMFMHSLYAHRETEGSRLSGEHSDMIKKVILYVRDHCSEPVTIADVASLADYSESHFMRLFKKETGMTFISFLNDYRLQYSAYLLKETRDPVNAVAINAGFENFSYFIRMFNQKYGISPGKYRRQHRAH